MQRIPLGVAFFLMWTEQIDAAVAESEFAGCDCHDLTEWVMIGELEVAYVEVGVAVIGEDGPHCVALAMAGFKRVKDGCWELRFSS